MKYRDNNGLEGMRGQFLVDHTLEHNVGKTKTTKHIEIKRTNIILLHKNMKN